MSVEENKKLLRQTVDEFWNKGNMSAIDKFYAGSYVGHDPSGAHDGGLERFKEYARSVFSAFPDIKLTIDDAISEGDKIVKRWTARCTHKGEFMGIPATGNKMEVTGDNHLPCREWKIRGILVEHRFPGHDAADGGHPQAGVMGTKAL